MKGRVAVVTGASQGIGRECALVLAESGARVIAASRSFDKLQELVSEIRAAGGEAHAVELDLASDESIKAAFAAASKLCGPTEILVNNAGVARDALALRMSRTDWDAVLQTNLTGAFLCSQAAMAFMTRKRWGRIINVASVVGFSGNIGQANYVSSKSGMIGLTKALALELARRNITVNAVAPGFVETAMAEALNETTRQAILDRVPLRRMAAPREIAYAVRYLASDEAAYVTGQTLHINGGMYV